jgi:hypothetical protein
MLEYLEYVGYAAFLILMFACLHHVIHCLETEGASEDRER